MSGFSKSVVVPFGAPARWTTGVSDMRPAYFKTYFRREGLQPVQLFVDNRHKNHDVVETMVTTLLLKEPDVNPTNG